MTRYLHFLEDNFMAYDLFVSYSRRDNAQCRVSELVDNIRLGFATFAGRDLKVFFDIEEIRSMDDWRLRILQGMRESHLFLACLSPSYIESDYCEWEFVEYLKNEIGLLHGLNGIAPIYFVNVPGWEDKNFDRRCAEWVTDLRRRQHFDLRPWHDEGAEALRETTVRERMEALNRSLAETIQNSELAEHAPGNIEAHNPHFIGRGSLLRQLRENFSRPETLGVLTALHGLGGLGKTALAVEYAHAFAWEYGGGRWQLRCAGHKDLRVVMAQLATPMGFEFTDEESQDPDRMLERVCRELKQRTSFHQPSRCLLILDNVDDPGLLDPTIVARLNCGDWMHILATTRLGENELSGYSRDRVFLSVDQLSPSEAVALIETYQPNRRFASTAECQAANEIALFLDCFTLAIEATAVYLGKYAGEIDSTQYLELLRNEGLSGLDDTTPQSGVHIRHGEIRLGVTLRPTLDRLLPTERLAMEYAALLPPDNVALPWLRSLLADTYPAIARDAAPGRPDPWLSLLRSLLSQRLLQATGERDASGRPRIARMHRLLQHLLLDGREEAALGKLQEAIDQLLRNRIAALIRIEEWQSARWELAPLTESAWLSNQRKRPNTSWLLNEVGQFWHRLAHWSQAEPLMRRALAIDEDELGPNHPMVAGRLNGLASLLYATFRWQEAEQFYRRALIIDEYNYGSSHLAVSTDLSNLAGLLAATGRLEDARQLYLRALDIVEKLPNPHREHHATCLNNLALLYQKLGLLIDAEKLMRSALEIWEKHSGLNSPNVASTLNNLAQLLQDSNRLKEAEDLMRRALSIDEKVFGLEHPNVARDLSNLAMLLQSTKRLEEAEQPLRRALDINEKCFKPEHPEVARTLNNLGMLLHAANRGNDAEALFRRALTVDERNYPPNHSIIALRVNNLAVSLFLQMKYAQAAPLFRRYIEILLNSKRASREADAQLQEAIDSYKQALAAQGDDQSTVMARLREIISVLTPEVDADVSSPSAENAPSGKSIDPAK
jgi:tetratricopeptide (TPR) repeat protein